MCTHTSYFYISLKNVQSQYSREIRQRRGEKILYQSEEKISMAFD